MISPLARGAQTTPSSLHRARMMRAGAPGGCNAPYGRSAGFREINAPEPRQRPGELDRTVRDIRSLGDVSERHDSHMSAHTGHSDFKNTMHRTVFIKFDYAIVYEEFLRVTAPVDTPLIL